MQSPVRDAPSTVERRRRGRGLDVMGFPTPDHQNIHLPTPVTRRKPSDKPATSTHLPTPQTLPRKRKAATDDDNHVDHPLSPPSPSGHTTFVLSHASGDTTAPAPEPASVVRRRPGLLFAQQMGLHMGSAGQPARFGARLGAGIGMGGGMRHAHNKENPFIDDAPITAPYVPQSEPRSPGFTTRYVPQLLRRDGDRSMSPHPKARPRKTAVRMLVRDAPESSIAAQRRARMIDEDSNPFLSRPGEVVRARPTSEDHPLVTYVFRGAKKVFANPFIPPNEPYAPAELDPSHPEYDVHPCPPPRLLWPTKDKPETPRRQESHETPSRRRTHDEMEESDDEDFVEVEPRRGLLFGGVSSTRSTQKSSDVTGDGKTSPKKRPRLTDSGL